MCPTCLISSLFAIIAAVFAAIFGVFGAPPA
jgi:hypothetical protein